ncbi:MAG: hypothetical protein IPJ40_01795 [Saprospirales bacterium]|nr:hypothetical protein [Saprospirales bacterium]
MSTFYNLLFLPLFLSIPGTYVSPEAIHKARGVTLVATRSPYQTDPMTPLCELGADWIAVVPIAFSKQGQTDIRYDIAPWQWWGERPEGLRRTVELAHQAGLKVMLKPQLYLHGSWPGDIHFDNEADWHEWECNYLRFMGYMADLAQEINVDLLCIGTEIKLSATQRPDFWRDMAGQLRGCYEGPLVYAANWDEYAGITFWDAVDFIGIDAYFPLSETPTPSVQELQKAWKPIVRKIKKTSARYGRPVLFTEYGYLSVDQCAYENWELEKHVRSIPVNEQAQANALEALFATFWDEPWWAGSFLWKWFPGTEEHEGYPERDYTPQGKKAEQVINQWFIR